MLRMRVLPELSEHLQIGEVVEEDLGKSGHPGLKQTKLLALSLELARQPPEPELPLSIQKIALYLGCVLELGLAAVDVGQTFAKAMIAAAELPEKIPASSSNGLFLSKPLCS